MRRTAGHDEGQRTWQRVRVAAFQQRLAGTPVDIEIHHVRAPGNQRAADERGRCHPEPDNHRQDTTLLPRPTASKPSLREAPCRDSARREAGVVPPVTGRAMPESSVQLRTHDFQGPR